MSFVLCQHLTFFAEQALDTFNTALVTPIYYVIFTTCTLVASALLFEGWTKCADGSAKCEENCE